MTDIVGLSVNKRNQLPIGVLCVSEAESKLFEQVECRLVGGVVGEAHTADLVVVVLPWRALGVRGKAVGEKTPARSVVGLEDLVGNIEFLEEHRSAQTCNPSTNDGDADRMPLRGLVIVKGLPRERRWSIFMRTFEVQFAVLQLLQLLLNIELCDFDVHG